MKNARPITIVNITMMIRIGEAFELIRVDDSSIDLPSTFSSLVEYFV